MRFVSLVSLALISATSVAHATYDPKTVARLINEGCVYQSRTQGMPDMPLADIKELCACQANYVSVQNVPIDAVRSWNLRQTRQTITNYGATQAQKIDDLIEKSDGYCSPAAQNRAIRQEDREALGKNWYRYAKPYSKDYNQ